MFSITYILTKIFAYGDERRCLSGTLVPFDGLEFNLGTALHLSETLFDNLD